MGLGKAFHRVVAFFTASDVEVNEAEAILNEFLKDASTAANLTNSRIENHMEYFDQARDDDGIKNIILTAFQESFESTKQMKSRKNRGLSAEWLRSFDVRDSLKCFDTCKGGYQHRRYITNVDLYFLFKILGFIFASLRFMPRELISGEEVTEDFIKVLEGFEDPHLKPAKPYLDGRLLEWEPRIPTEETESKEFSRLREFIDNFVGIL